MAPREVDEFSGVETTGHEWDGIRELDNPMPRWWVWIFYATIVYAIGYMIYYPAIPLIETATQGISKQTTRSLLIEELAAADAAKAGLVTKIEQADLETIRSDDEMSRFAIAGGQSLYKVYCSQCHGSGAQGAPGYPNLNDDDWLWGGDLEAIYTTISHGVRNDEDEDARISDMPPFGDDLLEPEQISAVTDYVLKLSNQEHDADRAAAGTEVYAENCASCHGETGQGGREFGAPNLADALWLYGNTRAEIAVQIRAPKHGVMPAWQARLGDVSVKQLAVYVHSLGGGEKAVATAE